MRLAQVFIAAVPLVLLIASAGCSQAGPGKGQTLLLDGQRPAPEMYHVSVVAGPFGGQGKVLKGGPLGPEEPYANKCTFINDKGFFVVPKSGKAELHLRLAMRALDALKVEVVSRDPSGDQKFSQTLAAKGKWQDVVLALDPKLLPPGSTVYDITVFQVGKDKQAELYVDRVTLRER